MQGAQARLSGYWLCCSSERISSVRLAAIRRSMRKNFQTAGPWMMICRRRRPRPRNGAQS